jgi:hypothetical protein
MNHQVPVQATMVTGQAIPGSAFVKCGSEFDGEAPCLCDGARVGGAILMSRWRGFGLKAARICLVPRQRPREAGIKLSERRTELRRTQLSTLRDQLGVVRFNRHSRLPALHDPHASVVTVDGADEGEDAAMSERSVGFESICQESSDQVTLERIGARLQGFMVESGQPQPAVSIRATWRAFIGQLMTASTLP